jgi:hypothetical protein
VLGVGLADAMRQTTMTQCYSPPPPGSAVARMPGGDPGGRETNMLASPPPISVPPGYHYFQMHGTAYFLNLSTGEKVNLGPVDSGSSSFVTPPTIKKERAIVKMEPVSSSNLGATKRAAVVVLDLSETKKRRSAAKDDDVEVVEILTDDDDDDSVKKTCDLPNTCDFAFPKKELFTPSAKKGNTNSDESDGGETVLGSQEEDLLQSSDS